MSIGEHNNEKTEHATSDRTTQTTVDRLNQGRPQDVRSGKYERSVKV
jgi:hypothetical protein